MGWHELTQKLRDQKMKEIPVSGGKIGQDMNLVECPLVVGLGGPVQRILREISSVQITNTISGSPLVLSAKTIRKLILSISYWEQREQKSSNSGIKLLKMRRGGTSFLS